MGNARRKLLPTLPRNLQEVHVKLPSYNVTTSRNGHFLLVNDQESEILIFSCLINLKNLCVSVRIYVDGTFDYCTRFYTQLFTIHGYMNGPYVPLVFCVHPDKEYSSYHKCFEFLVRYCGEHSLTFRLEELAADFETWIHKAARAFWGTNAKILGAAMVLSVIFSPGYFLSAEGLGRVLF